MTKTIQVPLEEVIRVFRFLEKVHGEMHQPLAYQDARRVEAFVEANYPEARELYYGVVWNWLPREVQAAIEHGGPGGPGGPGDG